MTIEEKPGKNSGADWWANRSRKLIEEQKHSWKLLGDNYKNLSQVQTRTFEFDDFKINIQFNPARIISSSADVNASAIQSRKCFLCIDNLPEEQNGLRYDKSFIILSNPYPIFEEHFTIINKKHTEQTLIGHFDDFLNISRDLGVYYNTFYNGPQCGASAPDHMHFQAGTKNITPIEQEIDSLLNSSEHFILKSSKIEIRFVENRLRNFILIESGNKGELLYAFKIYIKAARKLSLPKEEPMMNLISSYENEKWRIIIFPRTKHRPSQFYLEGNKRLLISPAAIDMAGLLIVPRREDFEKINADDIIDIYKQVGFTKEYFEYIKKKLSDVF
jgi:ATP adenylyltransferase/5',5'''-P-1,P-4-tetraphosphate phosphorylase II